MVKLTPLKDLDFGFADARQYQSKQQFEKFKSIYFPDSAQINRIKDEPIYFVIGDKGTGKTALATYFISGQDKDIGGYSLFVQKEDFTRFYTFTKSVTEFDASDYGEMWKVVVSALICFQGSSDLLASGVMLSDKADKFFKTLQSMSFNSFDLSVFSAFKVLFSQMRSASQNFLGADYSSDAQFSFYLRAMQAYLNDVYLSLPPTSKRSFLFIDGLDARPTGGSGTHADHIRSVTGLLTAMLQLNHDGIAAQQSRAFRIVVLVRPDIFEKLELQNVNNIWRTNAIQIIYEVKFAKYRQSSLFHIADYLLYTQQEFFPQADYKLGTCWDQYLPDIVEHTPSAAKKSKKDDDAFIAIIRNTFNRPRDIIYYLTYWRTIALTKNDGNSAYFDPKYAREFKFIDYFNEYLLGEVRDSLAFYTDVSDYIAFIQFFHHLEKRLPKESRQSTRRVGELYDYRMPYFNSVDYYEAHKEYRDHFERSGQLIPEMFHKPELFLQLIYELGIVFYKTPGVNKPIWKTYNDAKASGDFRPQVRLDGEYRLHRGLARAIYRDFM